MNTGALDFLQWLGIDEINAADITFYSNFAKLPAYGGPARIWKPAADIVVAEEFLCIMVELPGVALEDIHLENQGDALALSGQKRSRESSKGCTYQNMELREGYFLRVFSLPLDANISDIQTTLTSGILKIFIPRNQKINARKISID